MKSDTANMTGDTPGQGGWGSRRGQRSPRRSCKKVKGQGHPLRGGVTAKKMFVFDAGVREFRSDIFRYGIIL